MSVPFVWPTPFEAYNELPYQFPLVDQQPVVRIPIAGPAPFNTLAVVRTRFDVITRFGIADGILRTARRTVPTALVLTGYDPERADQQHVEHSTTASLKMIEISAEISDPFSDGNTDFTYRIDDIVADSSLDEQGRWWITVDIADSEKEVYSAAQGELTSWVLCVEHRNPSAPPPPADQLANSAETIRYSELLTAYESYVSIPGAHLVDAARDLTSISRELSGLGQAGLAVEAQQTAVDALAMVSPSDSDRADYLITLAEARHNLIFRLVDAGRIADGLALAPETISDYRQYLVLPGADLERTAQDLTVLSKVLVDEGAPGSALDAQQAAVDALQRFTPAPDGRLDYLIRFTEAKHNLVFRAIDAGHLDQAVALVPETIAGYQDYVALPGADLARAAQDLRELAAELDAVGQADEAAEARRIEEAIAGGQTSLGSPAL